jgi:hypothetical protein
MRVVKKKIVCSNIILTGPKRTQSCVKYYMQKKNTKKRRSISLTTAILRQLMLILIFAMQLT